MKLIDKLKARLAAIAERLEAIVSVAETEQDGAMTDEQRAEFDALLTEKKGVIADLERAEAAAALSRPQDPGTGRTIPAGSGARVHDNRGDDPQQGFADMAEFAHAVRAASNPNAPVIDQRLNIVGAPTNFHRETSSSDGYMVPPAMREAIWRAVFEADGILQLVNPEPTESNSVQLLADETTPWGATGVQASWAAEGSQMTPSRLATQARNVALHKLFAFVTATDELLRDAPRLANRLTVQAAEAINYKAGEAIVNGDGVGKPLGWSTSAASVEIAKEGSQAADTVVAANVAKMLSRLLMFGGSPVWLINQDVLPQLVTMTLGDQPIWMPPNQGMTQAPGGFLLGRPVRFSEHCATVGDAGDIQLVNPAGYYAATKAGGISFASSMHLFFDYDIEAFRWTFRLGGQPYMSAPQSPAKGASTRSHFIRLAART